MPGSSTNYPHSGMPFPRHDQGIQTESQLGVLPEEGNGNPLQYSCLENPMGRGAQQATVHGVAKSQT